MNERLKQAIERLKLFWSERTKQQKMMALGLVGLLVVAVALTAFWRRERILFLSTAIYRRKKRDKLRQRLISAVFSRKLPITARRF